MSMRTDVIAAVASNGLLRSLHRLKVDAAKLLNADFVCSDCHAAGAWVASGKPAMRQYSSIHRLQCTGCGAQIVAKVVRAEPDNAACIRAGQEYATLRALQSAFPQDERFGTLEPLGFLESAGCAVVVTRLAPGDDLMSHLRGLDAEGAQSACHAAGVWLRKLHGSAPLVERALVLGVAEKLRYLHDSYDAVLSGERQTREARKLLADTAAGVGSLAMGATLLHGDFKPENMLCDGVRYVGLDVYWGDTAAAVYDLAPFLNHLWLGTHSVAGSRLACSQELAEAAFLSGYDEPCGRAVLRWVQLYFSLAYLGWYRRRGMLTASYANWKVRPLVRMLSEQLREALSD